MVSKMVAAWSTAIIQGNTVCLYIRLKNLTFTNLTCLSAGLSFLKFFSITPLNALKKKPSKALICKKKKKIE